MEYRKNIEDVFTPRNRNVNMEMYVHRPDLESGLKRALKRNSHTLIYGESGNGKSWLYKKVLDEMQIPYIVANCANASRLKSITNEICSALTEPGTVTKLGFNEDKAAEIGAYFAKGSLTNSSQYSISQEESLLKSFKLFNDSTPEKKIIVLDNLESIFSNKELMDELADIIILLDDTRYAACNINILLVGTPNGVLQYFRESKISESVANRIQETRAVANLTEDQTTEIIQKGFEQLGIEFDFMEIITLTTHIHNVTLGIAQRVHEYCEKLAFEIEDNDWRFNEKLIAITDNKWLLEGLRYAYQTIENHLNSRDTTVARRNQVIYSIGKIKLHQFDSADIDALIRKEFPSTIPQTNMGIGSILTELSDGESSLLNKNPKTNAYSIRDPRYLMCIRAMLYKNSDSTKVAKRNFAIGL